MSYSKLASKLIPASTTNYTQGRNGYKICKFTPHHMAGKLTATQCANVFKSANRGASANYAIGYDGEIVCCVEEENRTWASSSRMNDYQAITVEVANSSIGGNWPVSEAAWNSLIELAVDVCKRYNFRLEYTGTADGSLTRHNMFANTTCPGPYLTARMGELARIVNERLDAQNNITTYTPVKPTAAAALKVESGNANIRSIQTWLNNTYHFGISVDGIYGPATKKALIKAYQTELNKNGKKLSIDGIWGSKTESAYSITKNGSKGNLVRIIQSMLNCKGYDTKGIDGAFGANTLNAVKNFQSAKKLVTDGIIGKQTYKALFS